MALHCNHLTEQNYSKSLQGKKIFKDQCVRCFHQPSDHQGIYVCMKCFNSFCKSHIQSHCDDHKHLIYAQYTQTPIQSQEKEVQITKLAIGKQGGGVGGVQYKSDYHIYCHGCGTTNLQNHNVIEAQLQSLINTDSPFKKQSLVSWELQIFPCEHTLTLEQMVANKNLEKCTSCDLSTNLWLCLTCGNTGCGRKNYDGSGGNSHGIKHFEDTGHPLVVKLGTITAEGEASLYCYACNNDVKDDLLRDHLSILGINITQQQKTEKTTTELNLQINLNFTLSKLVEGRQNDNIPVYGNQYTGINNIGNSCYLNSVIQSLNGISEFNKLYSLQGKKHMSSCKRIPSDCFFCQVSKIGIGLNSGQYSQKITKKRIINNEQVVEQYQRGISPFDFKLLIADNNKQFLSNHQQDALEYLQFILSRLDKEEPNYNGFNTSTLFAYQHVNKQTCLKCNSYRIISNNDSQWRFPVRKPTKEDIEAHHQSLIHQKDPELRKSKELQDPEYEVPIQQCLESMRQGSVIEAFCDNCNKQAQFLSRWYFKTTPKYLLAVANRFVEQNWVPKKLNALIRFKTQKIDIRPFLFSNSGQGGTLMKQQSKVEYSQQNLQMLVDIGYNRNAAIRGLLANNDNIENACNWIMENMDKNLERPFEDEVSSQSGFKVNPSSMQIIKEMGFSDDQAKIALIKFKNNQEQAMEWLFTVEDAYQFKDLLNPKEQMKPEHPLVNNAEEYQLFAVIVHLGKSVHSGHYVAYVKKNHQWVLYNDQKVSISSRPLLGKGYLYLFRAL